MEERIIGNDIDGRLITTYHIKMNNVKKIMVKKDYKPHQLIRFYMQPLSPMVKKCFVNGDTGNDTIKIKKRKK